MSVKSKSLYLLLAGMLLLQACGNLGSLINPKENEASPSQDYIPVEDGPMHLSFVFPNEDVELLGTTVDSEGHIYYTTQDGVLYSLTSSGKKLWSFCGSYKGISEPFLGRDDTIYVLAQKSKLIAIDTNGQEKWVFDFESALASEPSMAPDGSIYLQVFNPDPEAHDYKIWRVFPDGTSTSFTLPLLVYMKNSTIDSNGNIYLWQIEKIQIFSPSGKNNKECKKDENRIASNILTGPDDLMIFAEGNLQTGIEKINAYKLDCSLVWNFEITTNGNFDNRYKLIYGSGSILYVGGPNGMLYSIEPSSGKLLWKSEPNVELGDIISVVKWKDGLTYAGGSSGKLIALDTDGKQVWQDDFYWPGAPYGLKTMPYGQLFVMQGSRILVYTHDSSVVYKLPQTAVPPSSKEQVEDEITSFVLDFIEKYEIRGTVDLVKSISKPWLNPPPDASIIIYAPALDNAERSWEYVDSKKPIKVWWYANNTLSPIDDNEKTQAIEEYRKIYMENTSQSIFAWGFYEFGITQISPDFRFVEVYIGVHCGSLCGHGVMYKIQRSPSGEWWIYDSTHLWQS